MINKIKQSLKAINNQHLLTTMMVLILIQPLIDLDYLMYPWLNPTGIPLPSTIVYFIGMPLVILMAYFLKETQKRKYFGLRLAMALWLAYTLLPTILWLKICLNSYI